MTEKQPPLAPKPAARPKLWRYYRERGLTSVEVGRVFGRSREWVRQVCLPFDDAKRVIPNEADIRTAYNWSSGEITPADWYPPELSPPAAIPAEAVSS